MVRRRRNMFCSLFLCKHRQGTDRCWYSCKKNCLNAPTLSHIHYYSLSSLSQTKKIFPKRTVGWTCSLLPQSLPSCGCLPALFGESCLHSCSTSTEPSTYPYHIVTHRSVLISLNKCQCFISQICVCVND